MSLSVKKSLLAVAIASSLAACGGGGGDSSPTTTSSNPTTLSGTVADGYLVGATVCLDLNKNKACDTGEPQAVTTEGGKYSFTVPVGTNANGFPVVAVADENTIDEDTGQRVANGFVLSAPAGKAAFVSPMSTMVQAKLEQNSAMKLEEAETQVKSDLGITSDISLFDDFVAEKENQGQDEQARQDYQKLHNIAQVVARSIGAELKDNTASQGNLSEEDFRALVEVIVDEVVSQIDSILTFVEQNADVESGDLTEDALKMAQQDDDYQAGNITGTLSININVDDEKLAQHKKQREAAEKAEAVSVESVLIEGVYFFESDLEHNGSNLFWSREYQAISADAEGQLNFVEYRLSDSRQFVEETEDDGSYQLLTANGWQRVNEAEDEAVRYNDDGTAILLLNGEPSEEIRVSSTEIEGEEIADFLSDGYQDLLGNQVFSNGAQAQTFIFKSLTDKYVVWIWDNDDETVGDIEPFGNSVHAEGAAGNGSATGADFEHVLAGEQSLYIGWDILARFTEAGLIEIYRSSNQNEDVIAAGKWEKTTVHGQEIVFIDLPDSIDHNWDENDGDRLFLTVIDGYLRIGEFSAAGSLEDIDDFGLNSVAKDDILAAISAGLQVDEATGGSSENSETPTTAEEPSEADVVTASDLVGSAFYSDADGEQVLSFFKTDGVYSEYSSEGGVVSQEDGSWSVTANGELVALGDNLGTLSMNDHGYSAGSGNESVDLIRVVDFSAHEFVGRSWWFEEGECVLTHAFYEDGTGTLLSTSACNESKGDFNWSISSSEPATLIIEWDEFDHEELYKLDSSDDSNIRMIIRETDNTRMEAAIVERGGMTGTADPEMD